MDNKVKIETKKIMYEKTITPTTNQKHKVKARQITGIWTHDDRYLDMCGNIHINAIVEENDFQRSIDVIRMNIKEAKEEDELKNTWKGEETIEI